MLIYEDIMVRDGTIEYFCFEQTVDYSYLFNNSEDKEEKKWWE
jgi:hypothetical protein